MDEKRRSEHKHKCKNLSRLVRMGIKRLKFVSEKPHILNLNLFNFSNFHVFKLSRF